MRTAPVSSLSRVAAFALAVLALGFGQTSRAVANDELEDTSPLWEPFVVDPEEEAPELRQPTDDEAREIPAALKKAARKRKKADVMPALLAIEDIQHKDLIKPLLKLMTHDNADVAFKATVALFPRADAKTWKSMWKNAFSNKANKRRYKIRSAVVVGMALNEVELTDRHVKEVMSDWRWMIGQPKKAYAGPLINYANAAARQKIKAMCRLLAEEIDEPSTDNPNSPANPPAEWWERRWYMNLPVRGMVVGVLKELTGQEFKSTEAAKTWFEENEKAFGFDW